MMALHFNTFFGYEQMLSEKPEIVLLGAMVVPFGLSIGISIIGWIFRKLNFNMYIIHTLLYTLLFTFIFGAITMLILFFITDRNGVRLAYCWLAVFTGMFFFSIVNANTITKMFTDWSKIIKN